MMDGVPAAAWQPVSSSRSHSRIIWLLAVPAFSAMVLSNGCTSLFQQNHVKKQEEAGTVNIAVLSVTPWAKYRDSVQPVFDLTSDQALAEAIPNTVDFETKMLDAFAQRYKIALPTSTFSNSTQTQSATGKPTTTTQNSTQSNASGDVSGLTAGTSPAGALTAPGLPPSTSVLGASVAFDPMMKYQAAAALYEQVQITNRYIKDAARGDQAFTPYLVQLQVSVLPKLPNQPIDTYLTVSFFQGDWDDPANSLPSSQDKRPKKQREVRVVPLLVTDDIEAAMDSRSLDKIRQEALLLSGSYYGVGGSADLQKTDDQLRTVLGHDLNSTFTVARVSENTFECRFGAMYSPKSEYAMIPQAHTVPVLILVPSNLAQSSSADDRTFRLATEATMIDVVHRSTLTGRTLDENYDDVLQVMHNRHVKVECSDFASASDNCANFRDAVRAVAANDYGKFVEDVGDIDPATKNRSLEYLYVEIAQLRGGNPVGSASLVVPKKVFPQLAKNGQSFTKDQTPLLVDDKKNATVAAVYGGAGIEPEDVEAELAVEYNGSFTFPASSVKVSADGNQLIASFPSLAAQGMNPKKFKRGDLRLSLFLRSDNELGLGERALLDQRPCAYQAKEENAPAFKMAVPTKFINSDANGNGTVQLIFTKVPKHGAAKLTVTGAQIVSVGPSAIVTPKDDGFAVNSNGVVTLSLTNLNSLSLVTISVADSKDDTQTLAPVQLQVLSRSPRYEAVVTPVSP
jgi:hypothetical protein